VAGCDAGVPNRSLDARWGYRGNNVCTMFVNIAKLDISAVDAAKPWTLKLYLRAYPASR